MTHFSQGGYDNTRPLCYNEAVSYKSIRRIVWCCPNKKIDLRVCARFVCTESFMKTFSQIIRNYWVDLVLLNLAFLLGCIPVVTIPASLSALSRALLRM